MLRYTALAGLMLVPFTAAVAAPTPVVGEKDGYRFEYTTKALQGGRVLIEGQMLNPTAPFTYTVEADGEVHGMVDGSPVAFDISPKQYEGLMAEVTQDNGVAVADASLVAH